MKRHTSGVQRLILDWSNGALRSKNLQSQSRRAPVRKLSQVRNSLAKNAVGKKYKEQQMGFTNRTVFLCRGAPLAQEVNDQKF